jgi:isocitrate/isopropylmalate dehydrogenase
MILNPQQFDVVVMPNEHGDVMADGAGALVGGLGLAPSACFGKDYAYFEPTHGRLPTWENTVNPTAILSAKMLLEYLVEELQ